MRRNLRILWLALVLAIAAVAAVPPARADMTRPTWSLGDYWEYHLQQTSILINTDGRSRMTEAGAGATAGAGAVAEAMVAAEAAADTAAAETGATRHCMHRSRAGPNYEHLRGQSVA